jgi:hypothetical protein
MSQHHSTSFDPYYEWLGIAPRDQPPNHYRLLGIDLFASSHTVIANAADRQRGHVRSFQSGEYGSESQRLQNEIAAARLCLLDERQKVPYDPRMRALVADGNLQGPEANVLDDYTLLD